MKKLMLLLIGGSIGAISVAHATTAQDLEGHTISCTSALRPRIFEFMGKISSGESIARITEVWPDNAVSMGTFVVSGSQIQIKDSFFFQPFIFDLKDFAKNNGVIQVPYRDCPENDVGTSNCSTKFDTCTLQ